MGKHQSRRLNVRDITHGRVTARQNDHRPRGVEKFPSIQFRDLVLQWAPIGYQRFPWRKRLPLWKGLLVEVMLQRTRAAQVIPSFRHLESSYPTAGSLENFTADDARLIIDPLGLAWRIPLFLALARQIAESKGRLPRNQKQLERLPGVGPYAAAAALSLHGNTRAAILDSNVVRIVCRVLGTPYDAETRRKKWLSELIDLLTPEVDFKEFNYGMIDLAMKVCKPRKPLCPECPLQTICATGTGTAGSVDLAPRRFSIGHASTS